MCFILVSTYADSTLSAKRIVSVFEEDEGIWKTLRYALHSVVLNAVTIQIAVFFFSQASMN